MAQPTTPLGFFHALFAPPLQAGVEHSKDTFDHIVDYTDTAAGAWDLFRVGNHAFAAIEMQMNPPCQGIGRAKEVFNTAGIGLSIPRIFFDINALRSSIVNFFVVQNLPYSDSLRAIKIAQAAKKSFLDATALTNTAAQIALFVDNAKVVVWSAARLRLLGCVFNATDALCDGAELIGEYFKLRYYSSLEAQPRNPEGAAKLREKKTLSWVILAKDIASIALATLSIASIFFSTAVSSIATPTVMLGLSAFWLTMKLVSYFYNKVIVEVHSAPV